MKRYGLCVAVLLVVSVAAAQEKPAPSQTWTAKGASLAEFQVKLTPGKEVDLSTPQACVEAFNSLAVGSPVSWARIDEIESSISDVVEAEMQEALAGLSAGLRNVPRAPLCKRTGVAIAWTLQEPDAARMPWTETDADLQDGDVIVVAVTAGGGGSNPGGGETRYAYLCREHSEGQWRVAGLRELRRPPPREIIRPADPEGGGAATARGRPVWVDVDPGFWKLAAVEPLSAPPHEAAGLEGCVRGVVEDVLYGRLRIRAKLVQRVLAAWLDALRPLMSPQWVTELEAAAAEVTGWALASYEVLDVRDTGVVVRMEDEARSQWLFECEEADGRWVVKGVKRRFTATRVRDGVEVERLEPDPDIWTVVNISPLTLHSAGLYLRE